MTPSDLAYTSAAELARMIRAREISAVEVMRATLARAREGAGGLQLLHHDLRGAGARRCRGRRRGARPRRRRSGRCTACRSTSRTWSTPRACARRSPPTSTSTTCPQADCVSVARLKAAGAILIGKTTTPEFGHMPYTEAPLFGRTRNAWDAEPHQRRLLGRRGGGAAPPASARSAVGTDARRLDAHSRRLQRRRRLQAVGRRGPARHVARGVRQRLLASTPMTRTVMDTALMLEAMAGQHPSDPYSYGAPTTGFVAAGTAERRSQGHAHRLAAAARQHGDRQRGAGAVRGARPWRLASSAPSVEPMDDDMEPIEPIWFAYSTRAVERALPRSAARSGATGMSPTLVRQMELGKDTTPRRRWPALLARTRSTARCRAGSTAST